MRLLYQMIKQVFSLYDENQILMNYKRAIWQFYMCYNLALAINGKQEISNKKKIFYKNLLLNEKDINNYYFNKIQKCMKKDIKEIFEAMKKLELSKEKEFEYSEIASDPSKVGMLAIEFEAL